jgi:hypothetical protein
MRQKTNKRNLIHVIHKSKFKKAKLNLNMYINKKSKYINTQKRRGEQFTVFHS